MYMYMYMYQAGTCFVMQLHVTDSFEWLTVYVNCGALKLRYLFTILQSIIISTLIIGGGSVHKWCVWGWGAD